MSTHSEKNLCSAQDSDELDRLKLKLADVRNFGLALLRAHEGDSIATDIAKAMIKLVGRL